VLLFLCLLLNSSWGIEVVSVASLIPGYALLLLVYYYKSLLALAAGEGISRDGTG